jgi:hypothetical protein
MRNGYPRAHPPYARRTRTIRESTVNSGRRRGTGVIGIAGTRTFPPRVQPLRGGPAARPAGTPSGTPLSEVDAAEEGAWSPATRPATPRSADLLGAIHVRPLRRTSPEFADRPLEARFGPCERPQVRRCTQRFALLLCQERVTASRVKTRLASTLCEFLRGQPARFDWA